VYAIGFYRLLLSEGSCRWSVGARSSDQLQHSGFSGAQPGDSNYNAVKQQMDADGAPLEYSSCT
jgi:hypothetical protein